MTRSTQLPGKYRLSSHIATVAAIISDKSRDVNSYLFFVLLLLLYLSSATPSYALELPNFKRLVQEQGSAVIKVTVSATKEAGDETNSLPNFNERELPEFFQKFFEELPNGPGAPPSALPSAGFGSGFVLSEDGYLVTNGHVIENASEISVGFPDGREFDAEIVGSDSRTDVALLKIDATGLPVLELGDSDQIKVGQWVLAIGSPFGFEYTATQGIVSALSRSLPSENYVPFIQTDVAVNPGNSGGPLFDLEGKVIGVNSQIFSRSGGYMGLSFAIPVNVVRSVATQLRDKGYVSRGWLGVSIQDINQPLAESFGLDRPAGALVAEVTEGSPASDAGLIVGDVILSFDDHKVDQSSDLPPLVANTSVGTVSTVELMRNRERISLEVTIREHADDRKTGERQEQDKDPILGMTAIPLDEKQKTALGVENGVLLGEVNPNSPAALAGLIKGDVLVSFNQVSVASIAQLRQLVTDTPKGQSVAVLIQREKRPVFAALTLPE